MKQFIWGKLASFDVSIQTGDEWTFIPRYVGAQATVRSVVKALKNHDESSEIGRAELWTSNWGLFCQIPVETAAAHQAVTDIKAGQLKGFSAGLDLKGRVNILGNRRVLMADSFDVFEASLCEQPLDKNAWVAISSVNIKELRANGRNASQSDSNRLKGRRPQMQIQLGPMPAGMRNGLEMMKAANSGSDLTLNGKHMPAEYLQTMMNLALSGSPVCFL